MGEVVAFDGGTPDRPNATIGQALFTAIVDELRAAGLPALPPRLIATAAKQGRVAIEAGVEPEVVLVGCIMAIRQGKSRYTTDIIGDVALMRAGLLLTPQEYRHHLQIESRKNNPAVASVREAMEAHRRKEIEKGDEA